jgi:hypothetical protein
VEVLKKSILNFLSELGENKEKIIYLMSIIPYIDDQEEANLFIGLKKDKTYG